MKTRTSRAAAGVSTAVLQYVLLMVLQFALIPIVLERAGQEVLGVFSFLTQVISWAGLTDLGFGVATSRSLCQAHGLQDQHHRFKAVFTTGRSFYLVSNTAFAVLLIGLGWNIGSLITVSANVGAEARKSLMLLAIWTVIRTPVSLYDQALISTQNMAAANTISAIGNVLRLLLSLTFLYLGAGLTGLMLANILSEAFILTTAARWYKRMFPSDCFGWGISDWVLFREMLSFGMTFMVMIIASKLGANTDSVLVGKMFGAVAVSVYYTSQLAGTVLYQAAFRLADNAVPGLNELYAQNATAQIRNVYCRLLRYSLIVAVPMAMGVLVFNRYFVTLWVGPLQYAGSWLTVALAIYLVTQVVNHVTAVVLTVYGDIQVMSVLGIGVGIAKILVALWVSRHVGLSGVMLASALVDTCAMVYLLPRVWRVLGVRGVNVCADVLGRVVASNVLTLVVVATVVVSGAPISWTWLLVCVATYAAAWIIGVVTGGLEASERKRAIAFLRVAVWKGA